MRVTPVVAKSDTGSYHTHARAELVELARRHAFGGRILDVGCGAGKLGERLLVQGIATEVVGVEADEQAARDAAEVLTHVVEGDVSLNATRDRLPGFDNVIAADVLEHLKDPLGVLKELVRLLPGTGQILISLPNVRNYRVLMDLVLRNEWRYVEEGICDITHLRFFTSRTAVRLCNEAGLSVSNVYGLVAGRSGTIAQLVPQLTTFAAVQTVLVASRRGTAPT